MKESGSKKTDPELRALLGCFLFSGDDTDKKIRVLSGGEKARVALAKTIVSKANFLMLDEPTNHLDMHSVELLAEALNKYEGSIILVSHDRFFISKTANKIWEIVDHKIKEFKGTYNEWVEWTERMEARKKLEEKSMKQEGKSEEKKENEPAKKEVSVAKHQENPAANVQKGGAPINRELQKELQKFQRKLQQLEGDLSKAADNKLKLEAELANPSVYSDKIKYKVVETDYENSKKNLVSLNKEYETVFERVMVLEEQLN